MSVLLQHSVSTLLFGDRRERKERDIKMQVKCIKQMMAGKERNEKQVGGMEWGGEGQGEEERAQSL